MVYPANTREFPTQRPLVPRVSSKAKGMLKVKPEEERGDPYAGLVGLMTRMGHLRRAGSLMPLVSGWFALCGCLGPLLYSCLAAGVTGDERLEVAIFGSGGVTLAIKFFNIQLCQARARRILHRLRDLNDHGYERHGREVEAEFRRENLRALRTLFCVLNGFTPLALAKSLLTCLLLPRDHWKYPFPCWSPFDLREEFLINFIWQAIVISIVMHLGYIQYSFMYLSLNQTIAHMRVLCVMLASESPNVREVITRHVKIIKLLRELNDFFCWMLVIEIGFYTAQIALLGYTIIKMIHLHAGLGQIAEAFYVLFLYVSFAYFISLCGHKIEIENERIFKSVYESKWVGLPLQDQKALQLMLCYACRSKGLRFRNLVEFKMEGFSHLLNSTYSFLTLLSNMEI